MTSFQRVLRVLLMAMTGLLALTAIPGGAMLVLGIYSPPPEMLRGSWFSSFTIPGLTLALAIGGTALAASIQLRRRRATGVLCAAAAGLLVMTFEFVQVVSIGSPIGPSRAMQLAYFALGALLVLTSVGALFAAARPHPSLRS